MNEKLQNYLRMQIEMGRLTLEDIQIKYPDFEVVL